MYTPTELSKMYDVSLKTIYSKLKNERVKNFVMDTKEGKRLQQEGFNVFQMLMSESKVHNRVNLQSPKVNKGVNEEYIDLLKAQIEDLKKDKQILTDEKKILMNQIIEKDKIVEKHTAVLENTQKQLEKKEILLLESKEHNKKIADLYNTETNNPWYQTIFSKN